jgi:protein-S-isoprenylcysteine O-methyltransferase Ste14
MWTIRLVLLGLLAAYVGASGYLLKYRRKYGRLLESGPANLVLVVVYNLLCYLMVGLPSDPNVIRPPGFLAHPITHTGFSVVGQILTVLAAGMLVIALRQRKALGGQDVKEGLLTSGLYRYFRHPIYAGIVCISLGLALASVNWDGLLMFPAVFLMNTAQAAIEERYDVGVRFQSQYQAYRKRTRMFGPVWCWVALGGVLLVLVAIPHVR